jgi:mRNA interferase HigB
MVLRCVFIQASQMVIISKTILNEFSQIHPDVSDALNDWYDKTRQTDWGSLVDVRQTFNHVD